MVTDHLLSCPPLLDVTGCPGSVIRVLMLSILKVQYCDNWRMAAILTPLMQHDLWQHICFLWGKKGCCNFSNIFCKCFLNIWNKTKCQPQGNSLSASLIWIWTTSDLKELFHWFWRLFWTSNCMKCMRLLLQLNYGIIIICNYESHTKDVL